MPRPIRSWPWLTAAVALAAGLIAIADHGAEWAALRRSGEGPWRWWTTHAAHVSTSHLLTSGLVWLIAGAAVERTSRASVALLLIAGAPVIAWTALAADARMESYVGLSGLAAGCVVWLGLELAWKGRGETRDRLLGSAILVGLSARIAWDLMGAGEAWIATFDAATRPVRVARFAHLAGALVGSACWMISAWRRRVAPPSTPPAPLSLDK